MPSPTGSSEFCACIAGIERAVALCDNAEQRLAILNANRGVWKLRLARFEASATHPLGRPFPQLNADEFRAILARIDELHDEELACAKYRHPNPPLRNLRVPLVAGLMLGLLLAYALQPDDATAAPVLTAEGTIVFAGFLASIKTWVTHALAATAGALVMACFIMRGEQ